MSTSRETFLETQRRIGGRFWLPLILWRLIWILPAHVARILLCTIMLIGWGKESAITAWDATR